MYVSRTNADESRALTPSDNTARRQRLAAALFATVVFSAAYAGWRLFYFLCDDAYIAFRYVSNSMVGRGLVWNPAPFTPVEGYTSYLWVMVLKLVWSLTSIEPPDSANVLSFACGLGTLYLGYRFMQRMSLPPALERWRWGLLALVFIGTLTNRTFLAWLSSGLETALFNFLLTWWLYEATATAGRDRAAWIFRLSLSATLTALCRPDGLLLVLATPAILVVDASVPRLRLVHLWPLLAVPVHLVWRHSFYGYWLPNTYYAKYAGAWPESGIRYLASFVVEYAVWIWFVLAALWLIQGLVRLVRMPQSERRALLPLAIPPLVVMAHVAYYTFIIGGDHFEYRVYSQWVMLLLISGVWLSSRVMKPRWMVPVVLAAYIVVGWPIPWLHWWDTKDLSTRDETEGLVHPLAGEFPAPLRPIVAAWDGWQAWLISHNVCVRHQEHKVFGEVLLAASPTREVGSQVPWEEHNVFVAHVVGVIGWSLPNVAVLDYYGLNDPIVARTPVLGVSSSRRMAHDRSPPPGYFECFAPNVSDSPRLHVTMRTTPLTDDQIRECQNRQWF